MSALATTPAIRVPNRTGIADLPTRPGKRITEVLTETKPWTCPPGVYKITLRGVAPGGGGGSTIDATKGAGAGGGGQPVSGDVDVEPNKQYQYTHGAKGVKGAAGFDGLSPDGTAGGTSSFVGPVGEPIKLVNVVFVGGGQGKGDGTGAAALGIAITSPLGYSKALTSTGGSGTAVGPAIGGKGGDADGIAGGPVGTIGPSGASGGSTPYGRGAQGGNTGQPANAVPDANSGAGGAGSGAGDGSTNHFAGSDGAEGFLAITYDR